MKIALLNTYAHGGAGIACRRLQAALETQPGTTATLVYREGTSPRWPFYAERLSFLPYESDKSVRFSFSLANFGHDISQHPVIQSADIIHLHWINQGFLSLRNIAQLAATGKPIFWTLHDMWAFTGGCHYNRGCQHFQNACGQCPYLRNPNNHDLSHRIWLQKKQYFPNNLRIVTCSNWLAGEARLSGLFRDHSVQAIPNPIDITLFKPLLEAQRRAVRAQLGITPDVKLLLFVAMKVSEARKGFHYLLGALQLLKTNDPGTAYQIMVLGKAEPEILEQIPYPVHPLGMVTDQATLAQWYSTADVFVIPSMEDNLPNTVMEAVACGTPVAAFATGGIPDMVVDGQNGYLVPPGDSLSLGQSISKLVANESQRQAMGQCARALVLERFSYDVVAKQYLAAYQGR